MELAREAVRQGRTLTHLPTLDNLEIYGTMIAPKEVVNTESEVTATPEATEKPAPKPKTTASKKKSTSTENNNDGTAKN